MLKQRVITALMLGVGIILAIFFLPDWAWGALISLVVLLAVREWCGLVKIGVLGQLVIALLSVLPILYCASTPRELIEDLPFLLAALYLISVSFWLFSVPTFLYFRMEPAGWYWKYFAAILMLSSCGMAMLELRRADPLLMVAAILVVCIADISAFFAGRRFGKRKLAPEISPGKTWEGVCGAIAGVLVFCLLLWFFVPAIRNALNLPLMLIFSLLAVAVCVMGDLYESLLKREAGVKDSGSLLPGHGGVLDRIDAMLAFMPCAGALLLFIQLA
ncbi:phosphatidate cytidylyltransferase [Uliginosibacterium sp. 31-12]|uniref:phosphatidate cytidylyltransferase n=1 Tax=Uliginosibacterium sp. 31-12 TaxID=3062781 RepID=UPI0026E47ACF|nr:phosphatidate cytidylyltransferase [Uliginosibacterium sp. 31-12]MDO6385224.1 phosphatidate cytidylyltransferase [Uliginosibacterium sp. 31-12]